jgi:hypothetical protein
MCVRENDGRGQRASGIVRSLTTVTPRATTITTIDNNNDDDDDHYG